LDPIQIFCGGDTGLERRPGTWFFSYGIVVDFVDGLAPSDENDAQYLCGWERQSTWAKTKRARF
jgi:hypothetical protein